MQETTGKAAMLRPANVWLCAISPGKDVYGADLVLIAGSGARITAWFTRTPFSMHFDQLCAVLRPSGTKGSPCNTCHWQRIHFAQCTHWDKRELECDSLVRTFRAHGIGLHCALDLSLYVFPWVNTDLAFRAEIVRSATRRGTIEPYCTWIIVASKCYIMVIVVIFGMCNFYGIFTRAHVEWRDALRWSWQRTHAHPSHFSPHANVHGVRKLKCGV